MNRLERRMIDFKKCKEEFDRYVSNFDMNIPNINNKYYHTYRVVDVAEKIAKSENLNEHDMFLAKTCALLHDIGRFEQEMMYGTFHDMRSFDHGNYGAELLSKDDYISKYLGTDEDKEICIKAVRNHNKFKTEENLTDRERYFVNLVRDSDKIDIMVIQKNNVTDGETEILPNVLESIRKREQHKILKEELDMNEVSEIGTIICFIFDLNFRESFRIIKERKLIENKIKLLKENCAKETTDEIEEIVNSYIESRI